MANVGPGVLNEDSNGTVLGGTASGAGNVISGNTGPGVEVEVVSNTTSSLLIEGNLIGLDANGTTAIGNTGQGIDFVSAGGSTVGGTSSGARNDISGNTGDGIYVDPSGGVSGELIQGNWIGLNKNAAVVGNTGVGVDLVGFSYNTIGGSTAGAGNVISGNSNASGSEIIVASNHNLIAGNIIGVAPDGSATLGNSTEFAINVTGSNNTIGGLEVIGATGVGARNIIGNANYVDVYVVGTGATSNVFEGNYVGVDAAGNATIAGNASPNGFLLEQYASGNTIGGTAVGSGNLISGFTNFGVSLSENYYDTTDNHNVVAGNMIGTDATGTTDIPNQIGVGDFGHFDTIGGTAMGAANLISGNSNSDISLQGTNALVIGNLIGTNAKGTAAVANPNPNTDAGVELGGTNNSIGSATVGNLISGVSAGIFGSGVGSVISGNQIGTDITGTKVISDTSGIYLNGSMASVTIGGTAPGAGNLISGSEFGIDDAGSPNVLIVGNLIGTTKSGLAALPNVAGINLSGTSLVTIGGTAAGSRNVISGNVEYGISLQNSDNTTIIQGNYIGPDITGEAGLGDGVHISGLGLTGNVIGGSVYGAGNVISGIWLDHTSGNLIEGNDIGTDATGTQALTAGSGGVLIGGSSSNTIGGTAFKARNVISGNAGAGIDFTDDSTSNTVLGNYIGTDQTGSHALPNHGPGIEFLENSGTNAGGNVIGGTVGGSRNIISGNLGDGILFSGANAQGDLVEGNSIGTDLLGTTALGNTGSGIEVSNGAGAISIGGSAAGAANLIAYNGSTLTGKQTAGILATSGPVLIRDNSLFSNARIGIDLTGSGVPLANSSEGSTNYPVLTGDTYNSTTGQSTYSGSLNASPNTSYEIEVFHLATADSNNHGEGQYLLGSIVVTTDQNGNASFLLERAGELAETYRSFRHGHQPRNPVHQRIRPESGNVQPSHGDGGVLRVGCRGNADRVRRQRIA